MIGSLSIDFIFYTCVGQSGLGKSTLVNTLFASHLIESKGRLNADEPSRQTTEIEAVSHRKSIFSLFPKTGSFPGELKNLFFSFV